MSEPDCLFCRIVQGEIPAELVRSDPDVVAFRDIHPQAPTHILLIPRKHIASVNELLDEGRWELGGVAQIVAWDGAHEAQGTQLVRALGQQVPPARGENIPGLVPGGEGAAEVRPAVGHRFDDGNRRDEDGTGWSVIEEGSDHRAHVGSILLERDQALGAGAAE